MFNRGIAIMVETAVKSSFLGKVKIENFVIDSEIIISIVEARGLLEKALPVCMD